MHTSLRHYSISVERSELTGRRLDAPPRARTEHRSQRRAERRSFTDRIRATLRPGPSLPAGT
jgi:hypothetical protein